MRFFCFNSLKAIDLLDSDKKDLISSHAKMIYKEVRALVDTVTNDRPLSSDIQKLIRFVKTKNLDL